MEPAEPTVAELQAALAERDRVIAELLARVAELERRLGQNSHNSNRPPSSEGYAKPAPKSRRRQGQRGTGGQPGHPGTTLCQVEEPDRVLVQRPQRCQRCDRSLRRARVSSVERRQVFDLPELRLQSTEYRIEHRRCRCGHTSMAAVPEGVTAPTQYGPGVRGVATYLCGAQHLPVGRAAETLADLLGAAVSEGSVVAWNERAAAGLDMFTTAVRNALTAAPVAHFDETGLRVDAALAWVHSASTPTLTLFTCHGKRGVEAMDEAGVLPTFTGVAVHDGWAPYRTYPDLTHALCNAHHLRELDAITSIAGQGDWAGAMTRLLGEINTTVDRARRDGATGLHPHLLAGYHRRYDQIIQTGWAANPNSPPRHRTKRSPAVNLLDRLDTHRAEVLRFAADFTVPFTNNTAEQDIRMVKIRQKVSGGLRTMTGARIFCALRSYLSTARKNGQHNLTVLRQLHQGKPWLPAQTC
ncbi:MAG TPA: IS66 family transposase [Streptosporangiaceae bacterium]|nr:IS66 family transposase [Streptosporangiaceae bacterium]